MKSRFELQTSDTGLICISDNDKNWHTKFETPNGDGGEFYNFIKSLKSGDIVVVSKKKRSERQ